MEHGSVKDLYEKHVAALGTDPLREDADFVKFVSACDTAKVPLCLT